MTRQEAMEALDVDYRATSDDIRANFRWLVYTYHPDNHSTGNETELRRVVEAFKTLYT